MLARFINTKPNSDQTGTFTTHTQMTRQLIELGLANLTKFLLKLLFENGWQDGNDGE